MLSVRSKTTQVGADVVRDILNQKEGNAFQVSLIILALTHTKSKNNLTKLLFLGCDNFSCATGAQCIISRNGPTCVCLEGMAGNPFPGGQCTRDVCGAGLPCAEPLTCVAGRCRQRCDSVVCGVGASCDKNTGKCLCNAFFVGNPELLCMPRTYFF